MVIAVLFEWRKNTIKYIDRDQLQKKTIYTFLFAYIKISKNHNKIIQNTFNGIQWFYKQ